MRIFTFYGFNCSDPKGIEIWHFEKQTRILCVRNSNVSAFTLLSHSVSAHPNVNCKQGLQFISFAHTENDGSILQPPTDVMFADEPHVRIRRTHKVHDSCRQVHTYTRISDVCVTNDKGRYSRSSYVTHGK